MAGRVLLPVDRQRAAPNRRLLPARFARALGSLRLAVCLLPAFATALFLGTVIESWHDRKTAQDLVYRAWWFVALLGLLGVNIFCAAAKKWPWQRHQTGFLITHLGLILLVTGGLVDSIAGTSGQMALVDSDDVQASRRGPRSTSQLVDREQQVIEVRRPRSGSNDALFAPFRAGPCAWQANAPMPHGADGLTAALLALARPLGPRQNWDLGDKAQLEVLAYWPHAKQEPFREQGSGAAFPALRFQLVSASVGALPPRWLAGTGDWRQARLGPGLVEMLGQELRPEQLAEFLAPPEPAHLGARGQLVVGAGGKAHRLDVAGLSSAGASLGTTGWTMRLGRYRPNALRPNDTRPSNPAVEFDLESPDHRTFSFTAAAQSSELVARTAPLPADIWVWYHPPDYRHGNDSLRAVLQFASGTDGKLYFRSFHSTSGAGFALEKSGETNTAGERQRVWSGMNWRFVVTDFMPRATLGQRFVAVGSDGGREESDAPAALHCRLTNGTATDFWIGETDAGLTPVAAGGETFYVGYHPLVRDLGFQLTLLRAEQTGEGGTTAGQSSLVSIRDARGADSEVVHEITLNRPLVHGGYQIYQAGYAALGYAENGKPYARALFVANRDPGLYLKYIGSVLLSCGIAVMFYMRAYFFRPRRGSGPSET